MVVEYNLTIWIQKARRRCIARPAKKSKRQQAKEKSEFIKAEAMKDVCSINPQCTRCQCHLKTALGRERHKCKGPPIQCSGVSMLFTMLMKY